MTIHSAAMHGPDFTCKGAINPYIPFNIVTSTVNSLQNLNHCTCVMKELRHMTMFAISYNIYVEMIILGNIGMQN